MMIGFVLSLSTRPTTTKAHLGTKIFVVNLMLIETVHASCQLYIQAKQALPDLLLEPWFALIGEEGGRKASARSTKRQGFSIFHALVLDCLSAGASGNDFSVFHGTNDRHVDTCLLSTSNVHGKNGGDVLCRTRFDCR